VSLRLSEANGGRVAGFAGLHTCGSVWACPVCSAKISARRASDLGDVLRWVEAKGGTVALVTLTLRHHDGIPLRESWNALGKAWSAVTSGKRWQADKVEFGILGYVRAVEVTHTDNGWHPHVHALVLFDGPVSAERAQIVADGMFDRWHAALLRKGFDSIRNSGGLDVRLAERAAVRLADYFTKNTYSERLAPGEGLDGLAAEATLGGQKKGRRSDSRTPFQILADGAETGLADDIELWWEWEEASKGRRQLTWSQGLREMAELDEEQSDEEIAEEVLDGDDLVILPGDTWRAIHRVAHELLNAAEAAGLPGVEKWLDERGLDYGRPMQVASLRKGI
jgi:hypothetical protein